MKPLIKDAQKLRGQTSQQRTDENTLVYTLEYYIEKHLSFCSERGQLLYKLAGPEAKRFHYSTHDYVLPISVFPLLQ